MRINSQDEKKLVSPALAIVLFAASLADSSALCLIWIGFCREQLKFIFIKIILILARRKSCNLDLRFSFDIFPPNVRHASRLAVVNSSHPRTLYSNA